MGYLVLNCDAGCIFVKNWQANNLLVIHQIDLSEFTIVDGDLLLYLVAAFFDEMLANLEVKELVFAR